MSVETLQAPKTSTIHPDLTKAAAPPPTHNQTLPDADKIVLFIGKVDEHEEKKIKLRAEGKRLRQQMINQGVKVGMIDRVRADLKREPETVLATEEEYRHYMMAVDSPIGTQLALFPLDVRKPSYSQKELLDRAFKSGRNLGLLGKDADTQKYPDHTDLGQEHLRGWNDGQKVNLDYFVSMQDEAEEADEAAATEKEAKLAEQKRKTQEKADAKRDAAAEKQAAKEVKAAKKKADAEAKKAAKPKKDKVARPDFTKGRKKH